LNIGSVKVTRRGSLLVYATLTLAMLSAAARDPLLAFIAVLPALALALDLLGLVLVARRECRVEVDRSELRLHLGDRVQVNGRVTCSDVVDVRSAGLLRVKSLKHSSPPEVLVEVEGLHVGSYDVGGLEVSRVTPLGMFSFTSKAPVRLSVRVTPRASYLLALAYEILAGRGLNPGFSELESSIRGDSGIYVYTREYVPGDSLRRVDWKATARMLRFMVKEYRLELGSLGMLALDLRCFGEHTCDDMASAALTVAITSYNMGGYLRVLELDTGRLLEMTSRELLAYTITKVLEPEIAGKLDLQVYVPPLTLKELQRIASKLGYGVRVKPITRADVEGATVILATLLVENQRILDVVEEARNKGNPVIIVTPRKPWLDMGSLEDAYAAYATYVKIAAKVKSMGAQVYTCCPLHRTPEWRGPPPI
jgi:Uncharacterized conserved protein (some members contain a von Willebrand factor type A (vWA) domain)